MHGRKKLPYILSGILSNTSHAHRKTHSSLASISTDNQNHFMSLLKSCLHPSDLLKGRQLHAKIILNGINCNLLNTRILGMYVLCRGFNDANMMFFRVEKDSPAPWNWLIRGFTMVGWFQFAILFYFKMWQAGALPDKFTYPYVLKSCCAISAFKLGKVIHNSIVSLGLETNVHVGSSLVKLHSESGYIDDAREVFDKMTEKDSVSWNVMLDGYIKRGYKEKAIDLFNIMRNTDFKPDYVTFTSLLSICTSNSNLNYGIQIHGLVLKHGLDSNETVSNTLLSMYSKCKCLNESKILFNSMQNINLVTWNSMISGSVQNGLIQEAFELFKKIQLNSLKPDSITLASFLPALFDSCPKLCTQIHSYIITNNIYMDAYLTSALIDIYFKCNNADMAEKVFYTSKEHDIVVFGAMISGYVFNGFYENALKSFRFVLKKGLKPNSIILSSVLPACFISLKLGKELHGFAIKNNFENKCYVASALIDMYAKSGMLEICNYIFENISSKDTIAWNSMIKNFAQNGEPEMAIDLFRQMGNERLGFDSVSISSALSACSSIPNLNFGKEIHGFITKSKLNKDSCVQSALIDVYSKCGNLELARMVFDKMPDRTIVTWNSMICSYGTHGKLKDSMDLFEKMQGLGFKPDHITFLGLISACAHAGEVGKGYQIYETMIDLHEISPNLEHYSCIVDLFGRAGQIDKALHFIEHMTCEPSAGIWGTILGACKKFGNVEIAELASEKLFRLDPNNSGYYVLMSNVHASSGRWEGASKVRNVMREKEVSKIKGYSWIDINGNRYLFGSCDKEHIEFEKVYFVLKGLILGLKDEGYVPNFDLCNY